MDRCVGGSAPSSAPASRTDPVWLRATTVHAPKALARADSTAGLRGAKGTLWEGGLRVPSILCWPAAVAPGRTIGALCGTLDLLPTIAAVLGSSAGGGLDGTSLMPLLPATRTSPVPRPRLLDRARARPTLHGDRILAAMARGEVHPEETPPSADTELKSREPLPEAAWIGAGSSTDPGRGQ